MAFTRITLGFFVEKCILFHTLAFAGIAWQADGASTFAGSLAGYTKNVPHHTQLFLDASLLHDLGKGNTHIDIQIGTVKHFLAWLALCRCIEGRSKVVRTVLPRAKELLVDK